MIRRRWRLLLTLTVLLLLGGLVMMPSVRWPVYGWLRGEAFYQGMPSSWWEQEIQECYTPAPYYSRHLFSTPQSEQRLKPGFWYWQREDTPTVWERVLFRFDRGAQVAYVLAALNGEHRPPLPEGDTVGLPVLRALLHSRHAKVRLAAVVGLAELRTPEVAEDLRGALEDDDDDVRAHVRWALALLDGQADQR
jgi:hypothetical protein